MAIGVIPFTALVSSSFAGFSRNYPMFNVSEIDRSKKR
jgi:hypothetical protein